MGITNARNDPRRKRSNSCLCEGGHPGEVLVCDGHVSGEEFYNKSSTYHDHYGPNGRVFADRGAYNGTELPEILAGKISRYPR